MQAQSLFLTFLIGSFETGSKFQRGFVVIPTDLSSGSKYFWVRLWLSPMFLVSSPPVIFFT
ncbi:hypothetical protein LEP1GSC086_4485 [Leptospira weilii str. LNT 1234]|nr:hypothetical protein LEP1GSC086_4485 [Leptospira weilii str. LNT 1234]